MMFIGLRWKFDVIFTSQLLLVIYLQEPVAFFGGIFAGILRLDLNEEPLKEWVTRTVEAAGISEEDTEAERSTTEAAPQEIEIE